jgi:hypothetical protein
VAEGVLRKTARENRRSAIRLVVERVNHLVPMTEVQLPWLSHLYARGAILAPMRGARGRKGNHARSRWLHRVSLGVALRALLLLVELDVWRGAVERAGQVVREDRGKAVLERGACSSRRARR